MAFFGAFLHAAVLLLPVVVCGHGARCLADPAVVAFLVLASMLYWADAVKDLRLSAELGDDCGAAVPAAQEVGTNEGRRDARTTNLAESQNDAQPAWDVTTAATGQESLNVLALLTGLALLTAFWTALAARVGDASPALGWQQAAGAGVMLVGIVLRWLAVRRLGRFFVTSIQVTAEQPLVCDGVYRILRHP